MSRPRAPLAPVPRRPWLLFALVPGVVLLDLLGGWLVWRLVRRWG